MPRLMLQIGYPIQAVRDTQTCLAHSRSGFPSQRL